VRLATFNLLHGRSLSDGAVVAERLDEAVRRLHADVLGLQEVDRGQSRSDGRDLTREVARSMDADDWRFVPAVIGTPGLTWRPAVDHEGTDGPAYGCGLVSHYPVRSWHVVRLAAQRMPSPILLPGTRRVMWLKDEPRVAIAAVVEGPVGVMTVATTHLSFVPGWNGAQLRRVCRALEVLPGPRVLLGDLNMPSPFPGLLSRWQVLAKAPTYPVGAPRVQLDWALGHGALPPVRSVDTPSLPVSDHRALVVEL
jgi:endonuclease/exonuclease/phosphatase family metal-dependent hydrolase